MDARKEILEKFGQSWFSETEEMTKENCYIKWNDCLKAMKEYVQSLCDEDIGDKIDEAHRLMEILLPPEESGDSYEAESLYNILEELRLPATTSTTGPTEINGSILLKKLMDRKDEKNLNGQPITRIIEDKIGGSTTYIRHDAMVKTLNELIKELLSNGDSEGWISVEDRTPICYETGDWDGKKSDLFICQDEKGEYHLGSCYEYEDGQTEWYDKDDFGLRHNVVKWKPLT